ncbi:Palmitoyltransferase PFA3, partial [Dictyocoela roeselum]
ESKNTTIIFPHTSGEQEEPDLSDINPFIAREITKKTYDNVRTCMICHAYKPPRSHHCHVCNRCFLKMDHHCPQLGKCIEFHNYKCFVQFLAANSVFSLMTLISLVMRLFERNPAFLISYLIAVLIVGVDFVVSSGFAIFHVNLVLKNETTVEHSALNEMMKGSFNRTTVFQEGPV